VTVREAHPQAFAASAAAMAAGHVRCRPRLVDEHEAFRLQFDLAIEPVLTLLQDIGAVLLDGVAGLFLRVMPRRAKKRWRLATETDRPTSASAWRSSRLCAGVSGIFQSDLARMSAPRQARGC
jgi:hypothetical protein